MSLTPSKQDLVIIGVHMDELGEVDAAGKMEERVAICQKGLWGGRDVPFSNALISGRQPFNKEPGRVNEFGINSFPTTLLIDREGKVVGPFHFKDIATAVKFIANLLKTGKP